MQIVRQGSTGTGVYCLQAILRAACFPGLDGKPLDIDGYAGANTIHALKCLQKNLIAYGIDCGSGSEPDGVCGPKCWAALGME